MLSVVAPAPCSLFVLPVYSCLVISSVRRVTQCVVVGVFMAELSLSVHVCVRVLTFTGLLSVLSHTGF